MLLPYIVLANVPGNPIPSATEYATTTATKARAKATEEGKDVVWVEQTDDVWTAYRALYLDRNPHKRPTKTFRRG
jgi:hypothetical protein